MAAQAIGSALKNSNNDDLNQYSEALTREFGQYYKVARMFVKYIGNPRIMRECVRLGMHSKPLMEMLLRIMANLMRAENQGMAEKTYKVFASAVARENTSIK